MSTRVVLRNGTHIRSTAQGYPRTDNIVGTMQGGEIFTSRGNVEEGQNSWIVGVWDRTTTAAPHRWVNRNRNGVTNTISATADQRTRRVGIGAAARLGPGIGYGTNGRVDANQNVVTTHRATSHRDFDSGSTRRWMRIGARRWILDAILA